jgi:hypothetical protein
MKSFLTPIISAVAAALLATACASGPPEALKIQLASTDTSIQQAEQAGAAQNGLAELQLAKDKRAAAQRALDDKKYDTAIHLAQQAQVDAQYASRKSQTSEISRGAAEIERGHDALQRETDRAPTPTP